MTMIRIVWLVAAVLVIGGAPVLAGPTGRDREARNAARDGDASGRREARSGRERRSEMATPREVGRTLDRLRDRVGDIQDRQIRQERAQARSIRGDNPQRFGRVQNRERHLERRERDLVGRIERLAERTGRAKLDRRVERYERIQGAENRLEQRERRLGATLRGLLADDDATARRQNEVHSRLTRIQGQEIAAHRREARLFGRPDAFGPIPGPGPDPGPGPQPSPGPSPQPGPAPAPLPGPGPIAGPEPSPNPAPQPSPTPGPTAVATADAQSGGSGTVWDQRTFCRDLDATVAPEDSALGRDPTCRAPLVTLSPYRD